VGGRAAGARYRGDLSPNPKRFIASNRGFGAPSL